MGKEKTYHSSKIPSYVRLVASPSLEDGNPAVNPNDAILLTRNHSPQIEAIHLPRLARRLRITPGIFRTILFEEMTPENYVVKVSIDKSRQMYTLAPGQTYAALEQAVKDSYKLYQDRKSRDISLKELREQHRIPTERFQRFLYYGLEDFFERKGDRVRLREGISREKVEDICARLEHAFLLTQKKSGAGIEKEYKHLLGIFPELIEQYLEIVIQNDRGTVYTYREGKDAEGLNQELGARYEQKYGRKLVKRPKTIPPTLVQKTETERRASSLTKKKDLEQRVSSSRRESPQQSSRRGRLSLEGSTFYHDSDTSTYSHRTTAPPKKYSPHSRESHHASSPSSSSQPSFSPSTPSPTKSTNPSTSSVSPKSSKSSKPSKSSRSSRSSEPSTSSKSLKPSEPSPPSPEPRSGRLSLDDFPDDDDYDPAVDDAYEPEEE